MRIVVDVMGSDRGPQAMIQGAVEALKLPGNARIQKLILAGRRGEIESALAALGQRDHRIDVLHADDVLSMEDKPTDVLRKKKDCSMAKAVDSLKDGSADAVISPGNTGGLVAAAAVKLRQLEGVERPAIATVMPTTDSEFVLLDAGANPEVKPLHLLQFAIMGATYAECVLGKQKPRVGILSNGSEEMKGNDVTRESLKLCRRADLNFLGYVEGHDLFADRVDVVVADGFVGNIVLKTIESMGKCVQTILNREFRRNPLRMLGALIASGGFRDIKHRMNPDSYGGAPLLGVNGTVVKVHGSAKPAMVTNAVRQVSAAFNSKLNEQMRRAVAAANERVMAA
ncbi:MAG: phosphate acyltransferase PlsX [Verrucomicrobia bacterium]|nr:phosphate acyltransferase PlsX [Verrucomicrobiota bacterium]